MKMKNLEKDEVILFETEGTINNSKSKNDIIITNKAIFIESKGILKSKKEIKLDEIKMYRENVQININKEELIIQTIKEKVTIKCDSQKNAKKIVNIIKDLKCGSKIVRAHKKVKDAEKDIEAIIGITATIGKAAYRTLEISKKVPKIPKNVKFKK